MKASLYFGLTVTMVGLSGWVSGCGDDESGSGTTATTSGSTTAATTASSSSTGSTTGGGGEGGSTTGSTTNGSGGSGGNGTGGEAGYASCGECADQDNGAPMNECLTARDACFADPGCTEIHACVFGTPCDSDAAGACCTLDCYDSVGATPPSIALYEAFDGCVYCEECAALCGFDEYCAAIADPMCP
jgi:hypothetical protein